MSELFVVFAIASASAFIYSLLAKLGFIEWVQVHGNRFFHEMFSCNFCLSWWINVVVCIIVAIALHDWRFLFMPFITTMLTKFML